jgi:hypothetical protein
MTELKKLNRVQWDALYDQLIQTPDPDEGFTETGEHWKLIALLNRLGYNPYSRKAAVTLAQALIDNGYQYEGDMVKSNDDDSD